MKKKRKNWFKNRTSFGKLTKEQQRYLKSRYNNIRGNSNIEFFTQFEEEDNFWCAVSPTWIPKYIYRLRKVTK